MSNGKKYDLMSCADDSFLDTAMSDFNNCGVRNSGKTKFRTAVPIAAALAVVTVSAVLWKAGIFGRRPQNPVPELTTAPVPGVTLTETTAETETSAVTVTEKSSETADETAVLTAAAEQSGTAVSAPKTQAVGNGEVSALPAMPAPAESAADTEKTAEDPAAATGTAENSAHGNGYALFGDETAPPLRTLIDSSDGGDLSVSAESVPPAGSVDITPSVSRTFAEHSGEYVFFRVKITLYADGVAVTDKDTLADESSRLFSALGGDSGDTSLEVNTDGNGSRLFLNTTDASVLDVLPSAASPAYGYRVSFENE